MKDRVLLIKLIKIDIKKHYNQLAHPLWPVDYNALI